MEVITILFVIFASVMLNTMVYIISNDMVKSLYIIFVLNYGSSGMIDKFYRYELSSDKVVRSYLIAAHHPFLAKLLEWGSIELSCEEKVHIANSPHYCVRLMLLSSYTLSTELYSGFLQSNDRQMIAVLAGKKNLSLDLQKIILGYDSSFVEAHKVLAALADLSDEGKELLSSEKYGVDVHQILAGRADLSDEEKELLSSEKYGTDVHKVLAARADLSASIVSKLLEYNVFCIYETLIKKQVLCDHEIDKLLVESSDSDLIAMLAKYQKLSDDNVLFCLDYYYALMNLFKNDNIKMSVDILRKFIMHKYVGVRHLLAICEYVDKDILIALSTDPHIDVRKAVYENKKTPDIVKYNLSGEFGEV